MIIGAEIVNLPSGAQVIPHAQSLNSAYNQGKRSSSGNSINVNIANLNVRNDGKSVEELTFEIAEQIHYQLQNVLSIEWGSCIMSFLMQL